MWKILGRRVSDFNSRFEINFSVSVWLPFGTIIWRLIYHVLRFYRFHWIFDINFFLLFGVQVLKPYYYVYDER